jgi:membrane fusion protein (multidrug efflux system)
MRKRMIITLVTLFTFIFVIGMVKFFQIKAAIAQGAAWQPPPEAVTTVVTHVQHWSSSLSAIGSVVAVHGVTVSADLPGMVRKIEFESGHHVGAGDILVRLDTSQEEQQLAAAESQRDLTKLNLERSRQLLERQVISQAEYDQVAAEAKQAEARAGETRATIQRKTIRAPFAGVLGLRQVNLGQYLTGGDPVVSLQSMDPIYVDFSLPQQDVASLKVGAAVRVSADGIVIPESEGRITAINAVVDAETRNVQVQATFRNPKGQLRPGMFVHVQASFGRGDSVIALPASAVSYAPYGNSVFVVSDMKGPNGKAYRGVQQRFVKLGPGRGDQVSVLSGLKPGEEIVSSGVFKLRSGAAIFVNNSIVPSNSPSPTPEDN